MQKELFADLMELTTGDIKMTELEQVMRKHATKAQLKAMDKPAGQVDKDSITKTVQLTGYGHKAGADQDAAQFKHPNVFQYRTAVFPNPQAYGVTVLITAAKSVEQKSAVNPMYKWAIDLTLVVSGTKTKRESWLAAFENKVRVTNK